MKNREIKFRFWDLTQSKMIIHNIYGITQNPLGLSMSENIRPLLTINGDYCLPNWGQKSIAMQYTGLKDSNGVEIYEGDIVATENRDEEDNIYVCEYDTSEARFIFTSPFDGECIEENNYVTDFIIIGNRYENPELIK